MNIHIEITIFLIIGVTFAILGLFMMFMHIPKSEKFKYYRYSRYTLGTSFFLMFAYCLMKKPLEVLGEYTAMSFEMLFALLFSWMTYMSFLFIIYVERFRRRQFILDGMIPISMMFIAALIGLKFPELQHINSIVFGIIFSGKCIWMFSNCLREYLRCTRKLNNYYADAPDIRWMGFILWSTAGLSVFTVVSFLLPATRPVFYLLIFITYIILTVKLLNYVPIKISGMRLETAENEKEDIARREQEEKKDKTDFKKKLEPVINKWIESKGFVKPNLTIKDVAQEIGTNQNYLSKYINSIEGITFTVWLNRLRIEESKILLLSPEKYSIEEIGKSVGITELYNFSRWFKVVTEMTPQQYRKANSVK